MSCDIREWERRLAEQTAEQAATITVPRPKPGDVLLVITDADGASCWTFCPKADFGELGPQLLTHLEDGQRLVHEQRAAGTAV